MNALRALGALISWLLAATVTVLAILLFGRAFAEFVPPFAALVPVRALIARVDPTLVELIRRFGMPWSHEVRGFALPAAAVGLMVLRAVVQDAVESLLHRLLSRRAPAGASVPVRATAAPASTADLYSAPTVLTPGAPAGAAPPAAGTAFLPSQATQEATVLSRPLRIGRYDIIQELGRGAMGVVYKAMDPRIGRVVAIKTISAAGTGSEFEHYRARFIVEAKSAGRLNHPGVVSVYDVADDDQGRPCLVLEFVEGTALDKLVAEQPLTLVRTLELVSQVARALDYAHANGIVHRDVKPANIMVTPTGQPKLSDFGIAKLEGTSMTVAGQILGTPAFMSPEQCSGRSVDKRADIFSLGAVLYTLATGKKPFPGDTFTTVAYKVVHEPAKPATQIKAELPAELDRILGRCLAKSPDERYPSAAALADDLDALRTSLSAAVAA